MFRKLSAALAASLLLTSFGQAEASQLISGTYYEDFEYSNCGNQSCAITFTATPSSGFVNISSVSCAIVASGPISGDSLGVRDVVRYTALPISPSLNTGSSYILNFNIPIQFKVGANRVPIVNISSLNGTVASSSCTLVGNVSTQ